MSLKLVIAADSFKGSLSAPEACQIIASSIAEMVPAARIVLKPVADGGEGTAQAMIAARRGRWIPASVMGPLPGMTVETGFAWFDETETALVEMACASGITLLTPDQLNPLRTTTFGTGQLIRAALDLRPHEILLAIGGSATVDMGVGAAMALDWSFLDGDGETVGLGGGELERIERILPPDQRVRVPVKVLSDVENPLCGPNGAAAVFGPQKGADAPMVRRLEASIRKVSDLVRTALGPDLSAIPGGGAAGGLGAGAAAFMNAEIVSGIETIIEVSQLREELKTADWVITGEGKFDSQSLQGKVVSGILRASKETNARVAVIAGAVQLDESRYRLAGVTDAMGLKQEGMTTEYAMQNSKRLLKKAARQFAQKHLLSS